MQIYPRCGCVGFQGLSGHTYGVFCLRWSIAILMNWTLMWAFQKGQTPLSWVTSCPFLGRHVRSNPGRVGAAWWNGSCTWVKNDQYGCRKVLPTLHSRSHIWKKKTIKKDPYSLKSLMLLGTKRLSNRSQTHLWVYFSCSLLQPEPQPPIFT